MAIIPKKTKFRLSFRNKFKNYERKATAFNQLSGLCKTTACWRLALFRSRTSPEKAVWVGPIKQNNYVLNPANNSLNFFASQDQSCSNNITKNAWVARFPNIRATPCAFGSNIINNSAVTAFMAKNKLFFETYQHSETHNAVTNEHNKTQYHNFDLPAAYSSRCETGSNNASRSGRLVGAIVYPVAHGYSSSLLFGQYGICFEQHGTLSAKFIETVRLIIARRLRKKGRCWLRLCCDTPVTARPAETRMGKGKGSISFWQAKVYAGQMFFEFSALSQNTVTDIFVQLCKKSPLKLKLINA